MAVTLFDTSEDHPESTGVYRNMRATSLLALAI